MQIRWLTVLAVLGLGAIAAAPADAQTPSHLDTSVAVNSEQQIRVLEYRWNDAHVHGDTSALFILWADDLTVIVPGMAPMTKDALVGFWRTGRARVLRHETDSVRIRTWNDAAVVEGIVIRQRNFNGQVRDDRWRFTKAYFRRHGKWEVVAYHASVLPNTP
jgi:hypothetical protein